MRGFRHYRPRRDGFKCGRRGQSQIHFGAVAGGDRRTIRGLQGGLQNHLRHRQGADSPGGAKDFGGTERQGRHRKFRHRLPRFKNRFLQYEGRLLRAGHDGAGLFGFP